MQIYAVWLSLVWPEGPLDKPHLFYYHSATITHILLLFKPAFHLNWNGEQIKEKQSL